MKKELKLPQIMAYSHGMHHCYPEWTNVSYSGSAITVNKHGDYNVSSRIYCYSDIQNDYVIFRIKNPNQFIVLYCTQTGSLSTGVYEPIVECPMPFILNEKEVLTDSMYYTDNFRTLNLVFDECHQNGDKYIKRRGFNELTFMGVTYKLRFLHDGYDNIEKKVTSTLEIVSSVCESRNGPKTRYWSI